MSKHTGMLIEAALDLITIAADHNYHWYAIEQTARAIIQTSNAENEEHRRRASIALDRVKRNVQEYIGNDDRTDPDKSSAG